MRQAAGPRAGIENRGITSPSLRDPWDSLIEELTSLHSARRLRAARLSLPCRGRPCKPKKRRPCRISFCIRSGPEYIQPGPNTKRVANSICNPFLFLGGERGIRTPGTLRFNGFQDRRDRPLRQLSGDKSSTVFPFRQIFTAIYRPQRRSENQNQTIIFFFIRKLHIFVSKLGPRG